MDYESKGLAIEKSINELTLEEIDLPGAPASMQLERESSERSPERIRESDIDLYLDSRVYEKGNLRAETASIQVSPPRPGIFTLEAFNKELELCEVRLLNVRLRLLATERAQADLRAELSILESTHLEYQTQLQELIDLNAELLEVVPWYSLRKAEPVVPETGDQLRSDIPNQG